MVSGRSQAKTSGTNWEPPGDLIGLEENDLEEADIPEIFPFTQELSPLTGIGTGCTAIEYVVYATSYQVPAFYFTVSDSSQSLCSLFFDPLMG